MCVYVCLCVFVRGLLRKMMLLAATPCLKERRQERLIIVAGCLGEVFRISLRCHVFTYLHWLFRVQREDWFQRRKKKYENLSNPEYRDKTWEETLEVGDVVYAWW